MRALITCYQQQVWAVCEPYVSAHSSKEHTNWILHIVDSDGNDLTMHGYPQCLYPSEQSAKAGWQSKTLNRIGPCSDPDLEAAAESAPSDPPVRNAPSPTGRTPCVGRAPQLQRASQRGCTERMGLGLRRRHMRRQEGPVPPPRTSPRDPLGGALCPDAALPRRPDRQGRRDCGRPRAGRLRPPRCRLGRAGEPRPLSYPGRRSSEPRSAPSTSRWRFGPSPPHPPRVGNLIHFAGIS